MDRTADSLLYILSSTENVRRMDDAADALIGIAPTLDDDSLDGVLSSMTYIISSSNNDRRRRIAQKVLIAYKGVQRMR